MNKLDPVLFGDPEGWPLAPVVAWLITEGRRITEPTRFMDELCRQLIEAGAPIWRLRFNFQTLHPQVMAWAYTWKRGGQAEEFRAPHDILQTDAYIGSPMQWVHQTGQRVRYRLDRLKPERAHRVLIELAAAGGTDYVILPMVFSDGRINGFIATTDVPSGFSDSDLAKFSALINYLIPILEVIATRCIALALLNTYLGPRTGGKVLQGLIKRGDGETINAALWFSDLRGFTPLTETLPPDRLLAMLNAYFEALAMAVTARGGEILRFIGDAMLIVFPAQEEAELGQVCQAALNAALEAFDNVVTLNHERERSGEPAIRFGLGLHVGKVIYGNVGAPDRLDFTVMGPAVNRTARLEGLTKEVGVPLLLSADFVAHVDRGARSLGFYRMEGIAEPQEVFALTQGA